MRQFEFDVRIDAPLEKVWAFHERDDILRILAPPGAVIVSRKGALGTGSQVEFLIPAGPFRIRWVALHVGYEYQRFFIDEQVRGPFRSWRHEHLFQRDGSRTRLVDRVCCSLPLHAEVPFGWALDFALGREFARRHAVTKHYCES